MALQGKLRTPLRYITTHDSEGKATVDTSLAASAPFYELPNKEAAFAQCYVTNSFPAKLNSDADLAVYKDFLASPPGLTVSGGSVLRYVDMPPGVTSPMHRTVSLDYGVVIEGEVELVLDSGETRVMKRGDICVQRATMHAWRNMSDTEWARMLYVLQPCEAFETAGGKTEEDLGTMGGVRASS
ncbi:related to Cupin domain protein [Cephalotrichum gorgonifer]|uniref:Related to Cupin domain protein n=1 Tax=Cephalotrichum gorgonifer TaxID=2041049 RepID=A0AAE8SU78_9PEZI|nr:related to Cupin domain protein [Cephalotrichum gorgonifer]